MAPSNGCGVRTKERDAAGAVVTYVSRGMARSKLAQVGQVPHPGASNPYQVHFPCTQAWMADSRGSRRRRSIRCARRRQPAPRRRPFHRRTTPAGRESRRRRPWHHRPSSPAGRSSTSCGQQRRRQREEGVDAHRLANGRSADAREPPRRRAIAWGGQEVKKSPPSPSLPAYAALSLWRQVTRRYRGRTRRSRTPGEVPSIAVLDGAVADASPAGEVAAPRGTHPCRVDQGSRGVGSRRRSVRAPAQGRARSSTRPPPCRRRAPPRARGRATARGSGVAHAAPSRPPPERRPAKRARGLAAPDVSGAGRARLIVIPIDPP